MAALELPQSTVSRHWHISEMQGLWMTADRVSGCSIASFSTAATLYQEVLALLAVRLDGLTQVRKDKAALENLKSFRLESCPLIFRP